MGRGWRRPALEKVQAQRVAIIKPSALGDIVHALPVLEAIRLRFPQAHLTWIVNRPFASLLENHPALDELLIFDRRAMRRGLFCSISYAYSFAKQLRRQRFDLVFDLQGLLRSGLMTQLTAAPRRVGFANAREGATLFYTDHVVAPPFRQQHAVERNWLIAQALGMGHLEKRFRLPISEEANRWAATQLANFPRPWVVLGVGARWLTKRWLPEHFAALAQRSQATFGGTVLFIGSPDEAVLSREVRTHLKGPSLDWVGRTSLPQLIALLRVADAMIANDTGPLHLAAALGCPVVAPYTCTRVSLHGPVGSVVKTVETTVPCAGSYLKKCPRMDCMTELLPDRVWPSLFEVLSPWANRCRSA
jgi:lipopolysaccharide heptosyltransferase I